MRKIELQDVIDTNLPIDEVIQIIMDFCNQNQIKIKEMNDKVITGMYGSRLKAHTRGMRAEPSILPVKISINFQDKGNSTGLNVLMKEGFFGFPPLGMNKKYPLIFARLMNNLKLQFYKEMYIKEDTSKCKNCGKDIFYENQRYCEVCGYELLKI
ncbi:MAG: zinc ribbon domain-containing protein [Candidatus Lokiarchaeota archaeon]|nr:zinc ribbon domain-containing protein [Candidatus Lokiarchaeota archaeon]